MRQKMPLQKKQSMNVTNIELEKNSALKLTFDRDREIVLSTSASVVDWQRCLNKSASE